MDKSRHGIEEGGDDFNSALLETYADPVSRRLLRDLLRIVTLNWDFGPNSVFLKLRFSRDWRTIRTLLGFPVRTHNPLVVGSSPTGPTILLYTTSVLFGKTVITLDDRSVSVPSCDSL